MAVQRGMKRAEKVLKRSRKLKQKAREANLRKLERMLMEDSAEATESPAGEEKEAKKES